MNNFFVTHINRTNLIELTYARSSLYYICIIVLLLIIISIVSNRIKTRNHTSNNHFFAEDTTFLLKGVAIILLILGHASQQLTPGSQAIPFRVTGNAAVTIFLFASGVGLAKKYQLKVDKLFLFKRIKKLSIPVWLNLFLFFPLNFLLIGHKDPAGQIALNYCGVFWTKFPNSPCWFITYILFLYSVYFIAAMCPLKKEKQIFFLFLMPFVAAGLIIVTGSIDHLNLWPQYSIVFPAGVVCGLNAHHLKALSIKLFNFYTPVAVICMIILIWLYWTGFAVYRISHLLPYEFFTRLVFAAVNPVSLILLLILFVGLIEKLGLKSGILNFLGRHSFEIYLLHFPFMVYYDFFLFRKPFVFYFFIYSTCLIMLSVIFKTLVSILTEFLFLYELEKN